ncbi:PQQ-binding-like beta-propeller repeat protein [Pedobacter immunditicola]|uniref:outer membrane protein assembly factor BamB family protein n=1 Tax=Pedobacter immunditicola TaxID=3133440 RepID=UPI0030ABBE59
MKLNQIKLHFYLSLALFFLLHHSAGAQTFKYAFVTDTHIGIGTGDEDLRRTVADINRQNDLDFVLVTGDITEMGTLEEIKVAKEILSKLSKPVYLIPGNHDTGWSESGGVDFLNQFGDDKFTFDHKGYRFIACASGPYVRMSDGHIPRDATVWLEKLLQNTPKEMPLVFINHYPIDNSLDNWYEATDRIKKYNIQYAICGHGHSNRALNFEGIEGTMGRSNLRAKDSVGGYNVVTMRSDSVFFATKKPGITIENAWRKFALKTFNSTDNKQYERPSYAINEKYPQVKQSWTYHSAANVISTPATDNKIAVVGNAIGEIEALSLKDGSKKWTFKTKGAIYSSPVIVKDIVIFGSGDKNIYALKLNTGKLVWKYEAKAAVLGSPVVEKGLVYIGSSDHSFRALHVKTGKLVWEFNEVEGAIVGLPLVYKDKIIFGAWGRHLYALNKNNGQLVWKWNNGHANRMYSPAMVTPVATNDIIYIAAPDRVLTAINAKNGETMWRNKEATVRESIGISEDKSIIFGKTMNDEVVAYKTQSTDPGILWRLNLNYGYEHVPSMLIAKDGHVFFGTKNGVVYAFDPVAQKKLWAHKIDNSMVNTVNVINKDKILVATMDGVITLLVK